MLLFKTTIFITPGKIKYNSIKTIKKKKSSIVEWYEIKDYIEHNIKNPEKLPTKPPIYICINKINNRLVFEIKYEYKL